MTNRSVDATSAQVTLVSVVANEAASSNNQVRANLRFYPDDERVSRRDMEKHSRKEDTELDWQDQPKGEGAPLISCLQ